MNRKHLKHIIKSHFKKIKKYSRRIPDDFDLETIHKFRVEYKKLRAFFRLVNESTGRSKIKIQKKLKNVYSLAGNLRDLQLQQARLDESAKANLSQLPEYYFFLGREMMEIKSRLLELLSAKPFKKNKKKRVVSAPGGFKLPGFSTYLQNNCNAARDILLAWQLTDERLHLIRKILKDLFYNLEIYRQADEFPPGTWKEKVAAYFNPLLDEMGDYQDKCTAISLIESYCKQHFHTSDRDLVDILMQDWLNEKSARKKLLVNRLQSDLVLATGSVQHIPLILETAL